MKQVCTIGCTLLLLTAAVGIGPAIAVDEARQKYNKMVEEANKEADEYIQEQQAKMQEAKKRSQMQNDAEMQKRIADERRRLNQEMNTVRARGMGPNYTQGMKDNQLKQLQDRLDQLDADPEAYFGEQ